ncbi:MAG: uroporphyrinogen-III synthase [Bacteroidetes bacterium 4572_77]|nr:MAG: uroporphyrinogen-III synthase [Bacteroidetes bacterium 4572_77]
MKIKKVLISQPKPADIEKSPYFQLAKKYKVKIDFRKFISIEGVSAVEFRRDKVAILDHTAVIFTSRNAIDHYFRIAKDMRVEIPNDMKYFCVSEAVAYYLQKYVTYRKRKIFYGRGNFAGLMDVILKHKSDKYLMPCSNIYKQDLPSLLEKNKIKYSKAVIYKTLASDLSDINIDEYDMLIFFSPTGVESLFKNFPDYKQGETVIASFGPTTAEAVVESGLNLDIKAPTKTAPSMTMALEEYIQKNTK